jgi:WXG100 family type VII secretion target
MSVFTVDTDAVRSAEAAAVATMERLRTESTTLTAQLTQLQSSWTGSASAAFQSCVEQWRGTALQVEQSLESLGSSLGGAATQYADADLYSASLFR